MKWEKHLGYKIFIKLCTFFLVTSAKCTTLTLLPPPGLDSQTLQQTATAMTVDFDAVFGSKAEPSNNSPQPAAGKALALSDCPAGARLKLNPLLALLTVQP